MTLACVFLHHFHEWNELRLFLSTAETFYHCGIFKPTSGVHAVQFSHSVFLFNRFFPCHLESLFHCVVGLLFFFFPVVHIYRSIFLTYLHTKTHTVEHTKIYTEANFSVACVICVPHHFMQIDSNHIYWSEGSLWLPGSYLSTCSRP